MNKAEFEIYQGIIIPLRVEPVECIKLMENLISELSILEIDFPVDTQIVKLKIEELTELDQSKKTLWDIYKRYRRDETILKFSATINFDDKYYEEIESSDISSNDFYLKYVLSDSFEKRYYDFLISLDIARMGAFHHGIGLMFINKIFIKKLTDLRFPSTEVLADALEKKWPVFESLDILKTWNWYLTKVSPAGIDELSTNHLSRAINAFSHLYSSDASEIENLFWSMVGIEALYVRGKEGIGEQVKRKAQVFLGEIKEFKNRLTKMYDYRSGFVHGDKDFPSFFHIHDGLKSYDKYINEYSDALSISQALLIATIQKMAKLELCELNFKYVLE
jgi:hypothetical protein